jgi:hypothetical protein
MRDDTAGHPDSLVCPTSTRSTPSCPGCLPNSGTSRERTATIARSQTVVFRKRKLSQLSRGVDATHVAPSASPRSMAHSEVDDIPGPLLERTLRRRGLSDSFIHSTFMNQGGDGNEGNPCPVEPAGPWSAAGVALESTHPHGDLREDAGYLDYLAGRATGISS